MTSSHYMPLIQFLIIMLLIFSFSFLAADTVGWSAEDEIVLEPAIDAILKFSIFLSTRTYSTDFVP